MERLPVGKILQGLRKTQGVTQEQLGEILGVSSAAISKWENGQMYPDINFFPVLARYFNVSIDCLFGFSNELSEEEYQKYKRECTELFERRRYDTGTERIRTLSYMYPTNDRLKIDLMVSVLPYLAIAEDAEVRKKNAFEMITICQGCTEEEVLSQKHFLLAHLFLLVENNQTVAEEIMSVKLEKDDIPIDMTNSLLLRAEDSGAAKEINSSLKMLGIQILYELRNMASYLKRNHDLQGALRIMEKQGELIGLLELNSSLNFMLYMNMAYLNCLLGQNDNAKREINKFIALAEEIPISDMVLLRVYRTGFASEVFDRIRCSREFAELETLLKEGA